MRAMLQGGGHNGAPRCGVKTVVGGVPLEAERIPDRCERLREDLQGSLLRNRQADSDANLGHGEALGGKVGGQLGGLPQDELGAPLFDGGEHARERGADVSPGEHIAEDNRLRFLVGQLREPGHDCRPLLGRGVGERPMGEAGPFDLGGERRRCGNQHLMARSAEGTGERKQRPEVAEPSCRRHQHADGSLLSHRLPWCQQNLASMRGVRT